VATPLTCPRIQPFGKGFGQLASTLKRGGLASSLPPTGIAQAPATAATIRTEKKEAILRVGEFTAILDGLE
jgi:hypothetical protein